MACKYIFTDPITNVVSIFKTQEALYAHVEKNKAEIINQINKGAILNQIIGKKGAEQNKELKESLAKAVALEAEGKTKDEIFAETKWEKGKEGKWRRRLPTDSIVVNKNNITKAGITLKDVLIYPELYELYPELANIRVNVLPRENKARGSVSVTNIGKMFISLNEKLLDQDTLEAKEQLQNTLIHEVQHVVQALENFMYSQTNDNDFKDYFNSYAEVEARNAGTSSLIADEEKEGLQLYVTEDVATQDQRLSNPFVQGFTGTVVFDQDINGAYNTLNKIIYAVTNPNVSTPLHELAHTWEALLSKEERQQILDWANQNEWTVDTSEAFARGFEQYLLEGNQQTKEVNNIFDKFALWLNEIYTKVVEGLGLKLNDNMRNIYDNMLNIKAVVEKQEANKITTEQILTTPNTKEEFNFANISDIQKALQDGTYVNLLQQGKIDEATLRQVLSTNGLSENLANKVLFAANNKPVIDLIKEEIPTNKYNKDYLQKAKKLYAEGTLDQAAFNSLVTWDKYYSILDYIGEKTPQTKEQKVDTFVKKFYLKKQQQTVEVVEDLPNNITTETTTQDQEVYKTTIKNNSVTVGNITAINDGSSLVVREANVTTPRKGVGIEAYRQLAKEASNLGLQLQSDTFDRLSIEAVGLWNKLVANNEAIKGETQYTYQQKEQVQPSNVGVEEGSGGVGETENTTTEQTQFEEEITPVVEETSEVVVGSKIMYTGATHKGIKGKPQEVTATHESDPTVTEGFVRIKNFDTEVPLFTIRKATVEEIGAANNQQVTEEIKPTETTISVNDLVTFEGQEYMVNYIDKGFVLDKNNNEVETTLYNISQKAGAKTFNVQESQITKVKPSGAKQITTNHLLKVISNRFKQLFPQIETEIDSFSFDAPARFYNGRVQLNTNYQGIGLFKEGLAHEYMHPFVAALKISNKLLYNQLVAELKATEKGIIAEVEAKIKEGLYQEQDKIDEALVTFLGREISKAFDEQGVPREYASDETITARKQLRTLEEQRKRGEKIDEQLYAKVKQQSEEPSFIESKRQTLIQKFYKWWNDIMDFIFGKKQVRQVEDFVIAANNNQKQVSQIITKFIKNTKDAGLIYQYQRNYKPDAFVYETETTKDGNVKYKKDANGNKINSLDANGNKYTFKDLYEKTNQPIKSNFIFASRKNEDYGIEFEKQDKQILVYIDQEMFPNMGSIEVMREYSKRLSEFFTDNEEYDAYVNEFNAILDNNRLTDDVRIDTNNKIGVAALNPRMRLQDIVNLVQANLGKSAVMPIEYTQAELDVMQTMENYMKLSAEDAKVLAQKRETIVKRIKALADISARRIGEGVTFSKLKIDSEYLSKLNTFTTSDAEFIVDYIKTGVDSLNSAYRVFNDLRDDLKDKANLDQAKLNRINKEVEQIKQLVGMYEDIRALYRNYNEEFDQDELSSFTLATERQEIIKDQMKQMLAELAVEQIMPTIERNNESLKKQGYTKYILSREDVKKLLLNGSKQDIGWFAHMFGAPVNSTDTINAAISNSIADALNYVYSNNLESINEIVDQYKNFGVTGEKAQEQYYKDNYLRKARFWDVIDREENGKPIYGYVEKFAFHQDKLYDLFEDDLRIFKTKLPIAKNHEDDTKNQQAINAWVAANKDSSKYINQNFAKLKTDKYYQSLYNNYTKYNNKYGENRLRYGVIPQFYNDSFLKKWKEKLLAYKEVGKKDANLKERALQLGNAIFGEQIGKTDQRANNLDGTIYRSVNSNTTQFKDDTKLNFDLQAVMVDFISDAGNYEAKREVQFNIENIKQLLSGNTFFGIQERTIGTQDFATEFRQQRVAKEKLKKLDQELKNGATLYTTTFAKEVQTKYTNKGKTATNTDIDNEYDQLKLQAQGNAFKNVYDKFLGKLIPARTNRANTQITEFINDVLYNEDEYESHVKVGGRVFDLNKIGAGLGFTQAVVNMAGNVVAATNNVLMGNMQMFIEAHGGKYFTKKDLGKAIAQYTAELTKGSFIGDMKNPIKSEVTQYGLLFDAIQGEFTNDLGEKISGNVMRRFLSTNSLFLLTHAGEHQIQLTAMLAMMNAYKLKTKSGQEVSLAKAFEKDTNGRYNLKPDVIFTKEQKQDFVRKLHGVSRSLNGNYADLHKGHIQRYWYGKLMMQYRKYLYPAIVARYGQERVDLEKGTVETGYLRYFVGDYIFKNLAKKQFNLLKNYKNLTQDQKYWVRKGSIEIGAYILLTLAALGLGSGDAEKIKNLSQAEKALLLYTIRVHNEIGMYHIDAPTEFLKQTKTPIASMRFITGLAKVFTQAFHPTEVYDRDGNGYEEGDNKLAKQFKKLIPKIFTLPADNFKIDWDDYLSYQTLIQQMPR